MSGLPITSPVYVLTTALYSALAPVAPLLGAVPAYGWLRSQPGTDEALQAGVISGHIIAQAQTTFPTAGWVGEATSEGTIAVRCLALTDDGAQALLADAVAALGEGVDTPGYRVQLSYLAELVIPPLGDRHTAACTYRVSIRRAAAVGSSLLLESGDALLLESGDRILLEAA